MVRGDGKKKPFKPEPERFYDGGVDACEEEERQEAPPNSSYGVRIELLRHADGGRELFRMQRRIAYNDRTYGVLVVPPSTGDFNSDLTSVPALFTWLVPKTGRHLPATLLHDGLHHPPGDQTYISSKGFTVRRVEADRVLRDAMADAGTARIRRWLVWSAVATATMLDGSGTGWSKGLMLYYRATAALTVLLILALGIYASFDLFDAGIPTLPWMDSRPWSVALVAGLSGAVVILGLALEFWSKTHKRYYRVTAALTVLLIAALGIYAPFHLFDAGIPTLPWMGDRPWWVELVGGLSGAVLIPLALALVFWGPFRIAGAVVGVSLAALLYPTVALAFLTAVYQAVEWLTASWTPKWAKPLGCVALVGLLALFLLFITA